MSNREQVQLMKRAANSYCDTLAWPTVILITIVFPAYFLTPIAVVAGLMPAVAGMLVMAFLTYAVYTALHEAVHGAVCGGQQKHRWVNEWVGYLAAIPSAIPMCAHRYEHFSHHNHTNKVGEDPDLICADMTNSLWRLVASPMLLTAQQYQLFLQERWPTAHRELRRTFILEVCAIVLSRVLLLMALFGPVAASAGASSLSVGMDVALTLGVGPALGQVVLVYLFAYVVHMPHTVAGKFVDTSIFELPTVLRGVGTWLWGFQNYHGIHHAFPRVPWYQYRAVFEAHRDELFEQGMPTYQLSGLKWRRVN